MPGRPKVGEQCRRYLARIQAAGGMQKVLGLHSAHRRPPIISINRVKKGDLAGIVLEL